MGGPRPNRSRRLAEDDATTGSTNKTLVRSIKPGRNAERTPKRKRAAANKPARTSRRVLWTMQM
eukprot:6510311-Lingulodinium_polyedra.AAC.1